MSTGIGTACQGDECSRSGEALLSDMPHAGGNDIIALHAVGWRVVNLIRTKECFMSESKRLPFVI
jgi:hypothetical protein